MLAVLLALRPPFLPRIPRWRWLKPPCGATTAQLKTLLAAGAKADEPRFDKRTALAYAAAQGSLPAVQALLRGRRGGRTRAIRKAFRRS